MRRIVLLCLPFLLAGLPAHAQEEGGEEVIDRGAVDPAIQPHPASITVVATGLEGRDLRDSLPIAVLLEQEVRDLQGVDATRALRRLPGVTLTRNGGIGSFTGLSVRGAASEDLLVLLDGIRVNDPAAPGGGFDFGSLGASGIGKVELLRGPHSVIWGADALAGVLAIHSRAPDGIEGGVDYGGAEQFSGSLAYGTEGNLGEAAVSGGYAKGRGFSAAASGSEPDGYESWQLAAGGKAWLGSGFALEGSARLADVGAEIDGFPPPDYSLADTLERQDTRRLSGRSGLDWRGSHTQLRAGIAYARTIRDLFDADTGPDPTYSTQGNTWRAEFFGHHNFSGQLHDFQADFGFDWQRDSLFIDDGFSAASAADHLASAHLLLTRSADNLTLTFGARRDDHSTFGGATSLAASGNLRLAHNVTLRASWGEGFKVPSPFQLHSDYGNATLVPERSRAFDVGADIQARHLSLSLSAFRRTSTNLIDFVSCYGQNTGICAGRPYGTYDNIGRARAKGVEAEFDWLLGQDYSGDLHLRGNWSHVATRELDGAIPGNRLARRPRDAVNLSLDKALGQGLFDPKIGADLRYVSASWDDRANTTRLGSHVLVDLRLIRPLFEVGAGQRTLDLTARIENLFDARYQTAAGYRTQGRAAFIGLRIAQ